MTSGCGDGPTHWLGHHLSVGARPTRVANVTHMTSAEIAGAVELEPAGAAIRVTRVGEVRGLCATQPAFGATQAPSSRRAMGAVGPKRVRADSGRGHDNGQPLVSGTCGLPRCLPHFVGEGDGIDLASGIDLDERPSAGQGLEGLRTP